MKAYQLNRIDREYDMHLQAWLGVQAGSTKESGKKTVPVFKSFKEFFDYEKRISEVRESRQGKLKPKYSRMVQIASKVNAGKEVREDG